MRSAFFGQMGTWLARPSIGQPATTGMQPGQASPLPRLHLVPAALLLIAGTALIQTDQAGLALLVYLASVYLACRAMWRIFVSVRGTAMLSRQVSRRAVSSE